MLQIIVLYIFNIDLKQEVKISQHTHTSDMFTTISRTFHWSQSVKINYITTSSTKDNELGR